MEILENGNDNRIIRIIKFKITKQTKYNIIHFTWLGYILQQTS